MGCSRAMRDDVSTHRCVVKRLINGPLVTIAIEADSKCFREHEAYASWGTRDPTRSPSYVVDPHHIGCHQFPSPHAYSRCENGGFNLQPVTVELLVGKKFRRQDRRLASSGIIDLP